MGTPVAHLFDEAGTYLGEQLERVKGAVIAASDDVGTLTEFGMDKATALVDAVLQEQHIYTAVHGFIDAAKKGTGAATAYLEKHWDGLQGHLDALATEKPQLVGFIDGVANIFIATKVERHRQSSHYRHYVTYGRGVGAILSVTLFLPGFTARGIIGMLPYATRLWQYIEEKFAEADAAADQASRLEPANAGNCDGL